VIEGVNPAREGGRLSANGRPSLSLIDPQQVSRAVLSLNDQLDPSLTMFNAEKLPRAVFSIDGGNTCVYRKPHPV
jgi:hypothetical protein